MHQDGRAFRRCAGSSVALRRLLSDGASCPLEGWVSEPETPITHDQAPPSAPEEARLRFLAEAGAILAASLDYETELQRVARLTVPTLSPDQPHKIWQVLRSRRAWIDPAIEEKRFLAEARDPEHLALLRRLGYTAEMVLPLLARGRTLGAITLVLAGHDRRYGPDDLTLAEELARRAALAIDNARLYSQAQAAEARYRGLFAGVADAIVVANDAGVCQDVNDASCDLLGYAHDELIGLQLEAVVAASIDSGVGDESERRFWQGGWQGELDLRHRDGTIVPVEARTTAVELPNGGARTRTGSAWRRSSGPRTTPSSARRWMESSRVGIPARSGCMATARKR
jgi:PAS domain S-box-containing protein